MLIVASLAVAIVCFILYALDRKSKNEPIDFSQASKLSILGGLLTSGVVFASTAEPVNVVTEVVKEVIPEAQEMFLGTPSF